MGWYYANGLWGQHGWGGRSGFGLPLSGQPRLDIVGSTLLNYENNVDQNSYTTTSSASPTANALILLTVIQTATTPNGPSSFSGISGLTFVEIAQTGTAGFTHRL